MNETRFTPGPWKLDTVPTSIGSCHRIGPFPSHGVYEETHACVYADNIHEYMRGHDAIGDELEANAHLIAAAPELYGALEALWNAWAIEDDREHDLAMRDVLSMTTRALAKARGESVEVQP